MVFFKRLLHALRHHDIAKILFILSGTSLYFKWIIPINPYSDSWHIRSRKECFFKYISALILLRTHLFAGVACQIGLYWACHTFFPESTSFLYMATGVNIFINAYPVFVQWYIATRCNRILKIPGIQEIFLKKIFLQLKGFKGTATSSLELIKTN